MIESIKNPVHYTSTNLWFLHLLYFKGTGLHSLLVILNDSVTPLPRIVWPPRNATFYFLHSLTYTGVAPQNIVSFQLHGPCLQLRASTLESRVILFFQASLLPALILALASPCCALFNCYSGWLSMAEEATICTLTRFVKFMLSMFLWDILLLDNLPFTFFVPETVSVESFPLSSSPNPHLIPHSL